MSTHRVRCFWSYRPWMILSCVFVYTATRWKKKIINVECVARTNRCDLWWANFQIARNNRYETIDNAHYAEQDFRTRLSAVHSAPAVKRTEVRYVNFNRITDWTHTRHTHTRERNRAGGRARDSVTNVRRTEYTSMSIYTYISHWWCTMAGN